MIEGSHIDHGGHDNSSRVLINEVMDFDQAIGVALDFAQKDGHTLVVITADHETGGVTIIGGSMTSHTVKVNFSTKGHSAVMVPVYAFGPGAEKFTGIYDNTAFKGKLMNYYGFTQ
jgi:alkaline phosphatase